MANRIIDNRTLINAADNATGYVDLSGAAAGAVDTEIFYQGTGSIGQYVTTSLDGLMYNIGTPTNVAGNTFYFLINCGVVGLLDTKAAGGFRIRFTGATVTNWFEVYIAGRDSWPPSFAGGWTLFVIDIDEARASAITAGTTNGTVPATTAIQRFGWAGVTGGTMPRMVDNTWVDAIYRLPPVTPAIIVEGRNAGTTDWNWSDVVSEMQLVESPVARFGDGGAVTLSGPVQFGINDTTVHGFTDTNRTILWDDQEFAPPTGYFLSALGNAGGTTNVIFGEKSGTGDDAVGTQGLTITAATAGARWQMDFNDPNLDTIGFYGCSFQHGGDFQLDGPAVSSISTFFIDCTSANASGSTDFLRCSVVNADTLAANPFLTVATMDDIVFSSFQFSAGYAVEFTATTATQTSKGNLFAGYGLDDTDNSAISYNGGTAVELSVTSGGDAPTVDDRASGTVTVVAAINITLSGMKDNSEVRVYDAGTTTEIAGIEIATAGTTNSRTFSFSSTAGAVLDIKVFNINFIADDLRNFIVPTNDSEIPIAQRSDRVFRNP